MIRIICSKCKKAYLQKDGNKFICPDCGAVFSQDEENLLLGIQYYNEGNLEEADNHLMKYIVKVGAEPKAIIYKALCDGSDFDEDTISFSETYEKILESLSDISKEDFPYFLAVANDEMAKLEKDAAETHIRLFVLADAEKIKKEVSAIINLQNEAKAFRQKLYELSEKYNEEAENKISVKLSKCFLVSPEIATEVGEEKFQKISESIASHTVFTGILSTDIKNLEIYYRCIVMFFCRNRQKYEFLMESAKKFEELNSILENGQYSTIKGVTAIGEKLKSAGYDFFQESLKDHDDEQILQEETVVFLENETIEIKEEPEKNDEVQCKEAEISEFDDIFATKELQTVVEKSKEEEELKEASQKEKTEEVAEKPVEETTEVKEETTEETAEVDTEVTEEVAEEVAEEAAEETAEVDAKVIEEVTEETTETNVEEVPAKETVEPEVNDSKETDVSQNETEKTEKASKDESNETVGSINLKNVKKVDEKTPKAPVKRKKSYGPILIIVFIIVALIGIVAINIVPGRINAKNYQKAQKLFNDKQYSEAAEVYKNLNEYEDSKEKYNQSLYQYALQLEKDKKFEEAKEIYLSLGEYEDSTSKVTSCIYNGAVLLLEKGKYDEAAVKFQAVIDYADAKQQIKECTFNKASDLIVKKDYNTAIELLGTIEDHPQCKEKILEAKYLYCKDNYKKDDKLTVAYLKELENAKYKDSADLRRKLLGADKANQNNVAFVVNYSETDRVQNLDTATNTKPVYFHVTVDNPKYYNKNLVIQYTTSMGYTQSETIVLTKSNNSYALIYPSTPSKNYTVKFKLISNDNTLLATQTITIE